MFKNYLLITVRNLRKQKLYSFINIAGLSIGMAGCILILLWVQDELSYERFHTNCESLYRVVNYEKYSGGDELQFCQGPPLLASILKEKYPEITESTRIRRCQAVTVAYDNNRFNEKKLFLTDASFFEMFSFPIAQGNPATLFQDPYSIVVSREMARKYFGAEDPLGKTVRIDNRFDLIVTGVVQNKNLNSHLDFDFLAPMEIIKEFGIELDNWHSWAFHNYVLLERQSDYQIVSQKIENEIQANEPEAIATSFLQPLTDIHLHSQGMWGYGGDGDSRYVIIFTLIAILVLLTACINFMNLTTARSGNRACEIGIRKVIGANRAELIKQFYLEVLILSLGALLISVILVLDVLPLFNNFTAKQIHFDIFGNINILGILVATVVFTAVLAGSYPALFLSRFEPVRIIKGQLTKRGRVGSFRKILVTLQFTLTIALIIGSLIIYQQLNFIRNQKLGFQKDNILIVNLQGDLPGKAETLKNHFLSNPHVKASAASSGHPMGIGASFILSDWDGCQPDQQFLCHMLSVDHDFLNTMKMEMAAGRFFSREFPSDLGKNLIINEAAARMMGMQSPVGMHVGDFSIIGVIKDFNFRSLHEKINPMILYIAPQDYDRLLLRLDDHNAQNAIASLESTWKNNVPAIPFEFSFLNEKMEELYRADLRIEKIINAFTLLLIVIAALGLYGLAAFTAEKRSKEIGVRKVMGASVPNIVILLVKEYTKWVLIASLIAWPLAYFVLAKYLENYAYRIDLQIWPFLLSGLLTLSIAIVTVCYQSLRAAFSNPIDSLRYE